MEDYYKLRFFDDSTIYYHGLVHLLDGEFAWNLSQALFNLKNWVSLLPITLLVSTATFLKAIFGFNIGSHRRNEWTHLAI